MQIRFDVKEDEDEVLLGLTQKTGRGDETADKKTTVGFTIMRVGGASQIRYAKLSRMRHNFLLYC